MNRDECPICRHVEKSRIDHAILEGKPDSYFKENFAADADSVHWHKENCLPAQDPAGLLNGGEAAHLGHLRQMRQTALDIARRAAEDEKLWRTALAAMNAAGRLIAQEAKLRDRRRPPAPRLADSEEWQHLKARILAVLDRFPGAREALAEALGDD